MKYLTTSALWAVLGAATLLAGCGGGGDDGPTGAAFTPTTADAAATQGVPSSAQQSVTGLVAFLTALIDQTSETAEPVVLGDAVLPTSEVDEPIALN